jgi:hypothetical protein
MSNFGIGGRIRGVPGNAIVRKSCDFDPKSPADRPVENRTHSILTRSASQSPR